MSISFPDKDGNTRTINPSPEPWAFISRFANVVKLHVRAAPPIYLSPDLARTLGALLIATAEDIEAQSIGQGTTKPIGVDLHGELIEPPASGDWAQLLNVLTEHLEKRRQGNE